MPPFPAVVACNLLIYSIMGCSPAASSSATTGRYSHSPTAPHAAVIPMIRLSTRWWNPYGTFSIIPVTTQLSLIYSSTDWATDLYIIPISHTVAPIFANTLTIIPHRHSQFIQVMINHRKITVVIGNNPPKRRDVFPAVVTPVELNREQKHKEKVIE